MATKHLERQIQFHCMSRYSGWTACGLFVSANTVLDGTLRAPTDAAGIAKYPSLVTCKNCRRSRLWRSRSKRRSATL